jgi:outer membrane biosynthesis protein TonB
MSTVAKKVVASSPARPETGAELKTASTAATPVVAAKAAARTKAKPVARKAAVKPAPKTTPKPTVKPVAKPASKPAPKPKAEKAAKVKKPKLVRDSFTIPKPEYAVLDELKQRAGKLAHPAKKSELLRAGIKALAAMSDAALLSALKVVPTIKTGRPAKS